MRTFHSILAQSLLFTAFAISHNVALADMNSSSLDTDNISSEMSGNSLLPESNEALTTRQRLKEILRQKKFEDDSEITDTKLKADEGSRSEYSLKFTLSYAGPGLDSLNSPKLPNPDGSIGTYDSNIGGAIGARIRLSPEAAVSVGSGVTVIDPAQGATRYDTRNPFVSYDVSSKWGGFQIRNSFSLTDTTNPDYMIVGETGGVGYTNYVVYNLPNSRFALELDSSLSYWFFNRGYVTSDRTAGDYFLTFYPYVKYNATEKLNINSSLALQYMNPRSVDNPSVLTNKTLSQQLAVGYAITHDIYISPYINFYPAELTAASTTINFATTFSLL